MHCIGLSKWRVGDMVFIYERQLRTKVGFYRVCESRR
jgi:hypothetical protein